MDRITKLEERVNNLELMAKERTELLLTVMEQVKSLTDGKVIEGLSNRLCSVEAKISSVESTDNMYDLEGL